jgi:hypothetical protein
MSNTRLVKVSVNLVAILAPGARVVRGSIPRVQVIPPSHISALGDALPRCAKIF